MTATELKVGDSVLLTKGYGGRPEKTTVSKVTPKGLVEVSSLPTVKFKKHPGYSQEIEGTYIEVGKRSLRTIYPFSEETLTALNERADATEVNKKAIEMVREVEREAREAEKAEALAEVKTACGGVLPIDHSYTFPDDSRMHVLTLPVKSCHTERKKGYEVVIVRIKESDWDVDAEGVKKVEAFMTLANGGTQSFSSYSGQTYKDNVEALWDCCRVAYHAW